MRYVRRHPLIGCWIGWKGSGVTYSMFACTLWKESFAQNTTKENTRSKGKVEQKGKGSENERLRSLSLFSPHFKHNKHNKHRQYKETQRVMCPSGQRACIGSSHSPFVIVLCRCFTLWERERKGERVCGWEKKKRPRRWKSSSNVCLSVFVCAWILPRGKNWKRGFDLFAPFPHFPLYSFVVRWTLIATTEQQNLGCQ